jgi:hypothetical protein
MAIGANIMGVSSANFRVSRLCNTRHLHWLQFVTPVMALNGAKDKGADVNGKRGQPQTGKNVDNIVPACRNGLRHDEEE